MPRIVDHEERRRQLAEAVWRVVLRDGAQSASVRSVATEAGWSAGSLRHYFTSQAELLTFAMRLVTERVRARVLALPAGDSADTALDGAVARCEEVLPLDERRRVEAEVWLALTGSGLADPSLRAVRTEADDGMRELCTAVLHRLRHSGALAPELAEDLEAERLRALLDGLTLHLLLDPEPQPVLARGVLRHHLTELLA